MKEQTEMIKKFDEAKQSLMSMMSIITDTSEKVKERASKQHDLQIEKYKADTEINQMKREIGEFEALLTKYEDFDNILSNNILNLIDKYNKEWKESEKEWYNWNVDKLVGWFEYVLRSNCKNSLNKNNEQEMEKKESDDHEKKLNVNLGDNFENIDFCAIATKMKDDKYKCKNLSTLDEVELQEFGIDDDEYCDILLDEVERICEKYPKPARKSARKRRSENVFKEMKMDNLNNGNDKNNDKNEFVQEKEKEKEKQKDQEIEELQDIDIELISSGLSLICVFFVCGKCLSNIILKNDYSYNTSW